MLPAQAVGRYWGSAMNAVLTEFPEGDALVTLIWSDGARIDQYESTHAEARETLRRLGFVPSVTPRGRSWN